MNDKQQIEEMAQDIAYSCADMAYNACGEKTCCVCLAERLVKDNYRKLPKDSVVVSKEWWDKSRTQKAFKFYKDENLSKELYLIPYSVCIRPSDDNMSLLSLYKTLVWCGYASENYWDWCENTKEAKEVSFYEYIDELIKAIQEQARKETAREILCEINRIVNKNQIKVNRDDYEQFNFIYMVDCGDIALCLYKLAKQYGVEVDNE